MAATAIRRVQVTDQASRLFTRDGFANTSMKDVAGAVGLTASALYRHFPAKDAILGAAIFSGLDLVDSALGSATTLDETMGALAVVAVGRDDLWLLIRRESIHLDDTARRRVRRRLAGIESVLAGRVAALRPDASAASVRLMTRAAVAALGAPAQYRQRLERPRLVTGLRTMALQLCSFEPPHAMTAVASRPEPAGSRQDQLLDAAARVIAAKGYPGVTLAEIGDAAHMSGPSLYHHFTGKSDILAGVLRRAVVFIEADAARARQRWQDPVRALDGLLENYVTLATDRADLFVIFTRDAVHLPHDERFRVARAHGAFLEVWTGLLCAARPNLDAGDARLRVTTALAVVNEIAPRRVTLGRRVQPGQVAAIARSVLGISGDHRPAGDD